MKYKIIAMAVSGVLLSACGSDNDNRVEPTSTSVQAFDGAVRFIDTYMNCADNGWDYLGETGGKGIINVGKGNYPLFDEDPTQCSFKFGESAEPSGGGTNAAEDESNGKYMTKVVYTVPGSLIEAGQPIVGTPYTSLIAQAIEDDTSGLTVDQIIDNVFAATLPAGTELTDTQKKLLLSDPQAALDSMDDATSKSVQASTMILSDALVGAQEQLDEGDISEKRTVDEIANVTQTIATSLAAQDDFPINSAGKPTFVDYTEDLNDPIKFKTALDATPDPEEPLPPSTVTGDDPLQEGDVSEEIPPTEIPPIDEETPPATGGGGSTG
ncbi:hypothetical protein A9264_09595 [Vibrio sp. UCD-FRSSP16_10]|uniref:hypothetical protein n=1 Tax=unclassified Vibrio TaxID=2614977 RepID=UPI000800B7A6|nr:MULTISPECIES: hypothetical protein [unclassified Vibrio]OBT16972.1 hypothetical protein A9260_09820 [Vibrio sp. UCD-FRSSP16_30]OBT21963.1 hypothetical protein A9264_09595 [Vibrio sp. UCD-FRSSP16_10]